LYSLVLDGAMNLINAWCSLRGELSCLMPLRKHSMKWNVSRIECKQKDGFDDTIHGQLSTGTRDSCGGSRPRRWENNGHAIPMTIRTLPAL